MGGVDACHVLVIKEERAYGHCLELRWDLICLSSKA